MKPIVQSPALTLAFLHFPFWSVLNSTFDPSSEGIMTAVAPAMGWPSFDLTVPETRAKTWEKIGPASMMRIADIAAIKAIALAEDFFMAAPSFFRHDYKIGFREEIVNSARITGRRYFTSTGIGSGLRGSISLSSAIKLDKPAQSVLP